jgi:hypothetical protein
MRAGLSNFFKASDCKNGPVQLVIKCVKEEELGDDLKDCVYFEGVKKGFVLNKTNATLLCEELGDFDEDWEGQLVELYADKCQFGAKIVDCIRVRIPDDVEEDQEVAVATPKPRAKKSRKRKASK